MTVPVGNRAGRPVVVGWALGVALLVLVAVAVAVTMHLLGLGIARSVAVAAVRAVLQLAVVSVIIVAVVRSLWLSLRVRAGHARRGGADLGPRLTPDRNGLRWPFPLRSAPHR